MKNLSPIYLIISTLLVLTSCKSPSYYIPAMAGNDLSYLPKPMGSDSIKVKNYLSASFANMSLPYATGELSMGMLNYSRAHTFKNLNVAYGAFGFAGETSNHDYNYNDKVVAFANKGFIGGGLRTSIGYYDNAGNAEFRILSWENALSLESGGYTSFRKEMNALNDPDIVSSTKTMLFTTGGATEIIWHSKRNYNNHFAFRLFYGFTPGLDKSLENADHPKVFKGGAFDYAFYFKLNKLYGIVNSGINRGFTSKLSLGYSF